MLLVAADFPNTPVLALPVVHNGFSHRVYQFPGFSRYPSVKQEQGVDAKDDFSENIELKMLVGGVPNAYRAGRLVSPQMVERVLPE